MTTSPVQTTGRPATASPTVAIGGQVLGSSRLPVVAGTGTGADIVRLDLRRLHGCNDAEAVLRAVRGEVAAPLLVEPFSAADLPALDRHADAIMVGAAWMQDFRLLSAIGRIGLPVVVQRGQHATIAEWVSSADYLLAAGNGQVVLCESGSRTHLDRRRTLDLALVHEVRERTGMPVVVEVTGSPWLAGAAVAAGADGLLLDESAPAPDVATALEAATTLAPLVRQVGPASLPACREAIDRVDATLAGLLEYRAALATEVQRHKPVRGHAGRDPAREAQIVHAMAHRAPSLGKERLAVVMDAVISVGLDVSEEQLPPEPPVWRL